MVISFDTSNYTTSLAILDGDDILLDKRIPINVKLGMRGIRQSDACFQHIQNLDKMVIEYLPKYKPKIKQVAVSTRPRPISSSYMPVFNAGAIIAKTIALSLGVPIFETSHQEGHLFSALYHNTLPDSFLFFHMSGGTTELHHIELSGGAINISPLKTSADINFGQLIDRIGVKAGLKFPCGQSMNDLAKEILPLPKVPAFNVNNSFNLSGYENFFTDLLTKLPNEQVFYTLFITIGDIIKQLVISAASEYCQSNVLFAGGVAENSIIKQLLSQVLSKESIVTHFAQNGLARDNAIGVGRVAQFKNREEL